MPSSAHHLAFRHLREQLTQLLPEGWDGVVETRQTFSGMAGRLTFTDPEGQSVSLDVLMDMRPLVYAPESVQPMLQLWFTWAVRALEDAGED